MPGEIFQHGFDRDPGGGCGHAGFENRQKSLQHPGLIGNNHSLSCDASQFEIVSEGSRAGLEFFESGRDRKTLPR